MTKKEQQINTSPIIAGAIAIAAGGLLIYGLIANSDIMLDVVRFLLIISSIILIPWRR